MNTKLRIESVLNSVSLPSSITGLDTFELSELTLSHDLDFSLPNDLRLGHLIEQIVSQLVQSSSNFQLHHHGVQFKEGNKTIGEIDLIIQDNVTQQVSHIELAYKFYLLDPSISDRELNNWIGPNRNDSLHEKLAKTKNKQFPLLHGDLSQSELRSLKVEEVSQKLCLLASLFIPFGFEGQIGDGYRKAVKGYYLNWESFQQQHHSNRLYHLPPKKEWGMDPSDKSIWLNYSEIQGTIEKSMEESRSVLCWAKAEGSFSTFFITFW